MRTDTNTRTRDDQVELKYLGRRKTHYFKPMSTRNRYTAGEGKSIFAYPDDVPFLLAQHDRTIGALFAVVDQNADIEAPAIVPAADLLGNRAPKERKTARQGVKSVEAILQEHQESDDVLSTEE